MQKSFLLNFYILVSSWILLSSFMYFYKIMALWCVSNGCYGNKISPRIWSYLVVCCEDMQA